MESEKKTKWSLKPAASGSEFQEIVFEAPAESDSESGEFETKSESSDGEPKIELTQTSGKKGKFVVSETFWESIHEDPSVREALAKMVNEKARERVESESKQLLESWKQEAYEEGRQKGEAAGLKEAKEKHSEELKKLKYKLKDICFLLLEEKQKYLTSHEEAWCRAFSHLLKRFLVPRQGEILEYLKPWLKESIAAIGDQPKVKVRVSPEVFELIQKEVSGGEEDSVDPWVFVADPELKESEIRAESKEGGIFFSPSEQLEKLDHWIKEFCREEIPEGTKAA